MGGVCLARFEGFGFFGGLGVGVLESSLRVFPDSANTSLWSSFTIV